MQGRGWSVARRAMAVAVTASALGAVGAIAYAASDDAPAGVSAEPGGVPAPRVDPSYPANDSGQTYGSAALANAPGDEPDLILATATNGKQGYVKKTELDLVTGANVANPDEALAFQARMDAAASAGEVIYVPVYAVDGTTVIGQFEIAP